MIVNYNAHGHCVASISDPANSQLARWVDRRRRALKNGKFSEDSVKQDMTSDSSGLLVNTAMMLPFCLAYFCR